MNAQRCNPETTAHVPQRRARLWSALALAALLAGPGARAQGPVFDSTSTGADGALDFTGESGTIFFDPVEMELDPDGDGVYHFTTITIPADVTLRMLADRAGHGPVYWLATGPVQIDGSVNMWGQQGHTSGDPRLQAIPGPGGFPGGIGAKNFSVSTGGLGPSDAARNDFMLPLVGGSGNGGSGGTGGGGGGGALLIASSVSITVDGTILANGNWGLVSPGSGCCQGGAGMIRLLAPVISGSGLLQAWGTGTGRVRLEAFLDEFAGSFTNTRRVLRATLTENAIFLPTQLPSWVRVVSVEHFDEDLEEDVITVLPDPPTGLFEPPDGPDLTINTFQALTLEIEGRNIPTDRDVSLRLLVTPEVQANQGSTPVTVQFVGDNPGLSTATVSGVTLPSGFSRIFIRATWTP